MDAELVTFQLDTGTGEQTVSLAGSFTPNLIIFAANGQNAINSISALLRFAFGAASGTSGTDTYSNGLAAQNGVSTTDVGRLLQPEIHTGFSTTTSVQSFDVTSFAAGEFTIDILASDNSQRYVHALCLNVTSAKVGTFETPTGTGDDSITGVGFQPKLLILFSSNTTSSGFESNASLSFGAADGTNQFCINATDEDNQGTSDSHKYHDTANILHAVSVADGSDAQVAALSSFDADGFTLNYSTAGFALDYQYIAIDAPNVAVKSTYDHPTSTGSQSVTGAGFTPKCVIEATVNTTTTGAVQAGFDLNIGMATGAAAEGCVWGQSEDNVGTTNVDRIIRNDATLWYGDRSQNAVGVADFTAFNSDGHAKNWSVAPGTTRKGACIWMGDTQATTALPRSKVGDSLANNSPLLGALV